MSHPDFSYAWVTQQLQLLKVMATPHAFFRVLPIAEGYLLILVNLGACTRALLFNMHPLVPQLIGIMEWYLTNFPKMKFSASQMLTTPPPQILMPELGQGLILPTTHPCLAHYSCPFCFSHSIQNPLNMSYFWRTPINIGLQGYLVFFLLP